MRKWIHEGSQIEKTIPKIHPKNNAKIRHQKVDTRRYHGGEVCMCVGVCGGGGGENKKTKTKRKKTKKKKRHKNRCQKAKMKPNLIKLN